MTEPTARYRPSKEPGASDISLLKHGLIQIMCDIAAQVAQHRSRPLFALDVCAGKGYNAKRAATSSTQLLMSTLADLDSRGTPTRIMSIERYKPNYTELTRCYDEYFPHIHSDYMEATNDHDRAPRTLVLPMDFMHSESARHVTKRTPRPGETTLLCGDPNTPKGIEFSPTFQRQALPTLSIDTFFYTLGINAAGRKRGARSKRMAEYRMVWDTITASTMINGEPDTIFKHHDLCLVIPHNSNAQFHFVLGMPRSYKAEFQRQFNPLGAGWGYVASDIWYHTNPDRFTNTLQAGFLTGDEIARKWARS